VCVQDNGNRRGSFQARALSVFPRLCWNALASCTRNPAADCSISLSGLCFFQDIYIPSVQRLYHGKVDGLVSDVLLTVYSESNVMHFLFNLLRIKSLYMFRALLAHLQEALHKRQLVCCVRVMSVGWYQDWSGTGALHVWGISYSSSGGAAQTT
jgi:hypothetical protein